MSATEWCLSHRDGQKGTTPDQRVAALAGRRKGIVTRRQLVACGMTDRMIAVRVRRGWLHPVYRGVYAVGHASLSETAAFIAAVLACGADATLGFHAAAAHLDMLGHDGRDPDVIVPRNGGRKIDGIRVHRSRLDRRDVWTRDGIRVTSPARTILDLAATTGPKALRRLTRQAQAEQHVNVRQLLDVIDRHPHHRGAARLRATIADGPAPTRSDHEDLVLDLIDRAGIARPELNAWLHLDGRHISPDMLWRAQRVAIECDSRRWHSDPLTRQDDADKQAILEAHGYRVLRITWRQAVGRPRQTVARISGARSGS
jgi:predicted transcriptional regulator of viral defense system